MAKDSNAEDVDVGCAVAVCSDGVGGGNAGVSRAPLDVTDASYVAKDVGIEVVSCGVSVAAKSGCVGSGCGLKVDAPLAVSFMSSYTAQMIHYLISCSLLSNNTGWLIPSLLSIPPLGCCSHNP